ncbi:MAG TPA: exosortase/archaeosortase family protein [Verrucomicrobiae bacterium]
MSEAILVPVRAIAPVKKFALAAGVVTAPFALALWKLLWFATGDELYSYIPLIPLISAYLAWADRSKLPGVSVPARRLALLFLAAAALAVTGYFLLDPAVPLENQLALSTLAWIFLFTAAGCWFLGAAAMRVLAFPFFLLLFMIPLPVFLREGIEALLQQGSAAVAGWLFTLAGTPQIREGTAFRLPGISMEVARECSGIHSTVVLVITGILAGQLVLRRTGLKVILWLTLVPLALLRNGLRVFVIGELCVHFGPRMIDSSIHRHGGPVFFLLSLIPFFGLLYWLKQWEKPALRTPAPKET